MKLVRITCDIKFTKNCKNNAVIPTFAKVNNGAVSNNKKLDMMVSLLIMNTELERKHHERRELKRDINVRSLRHYSSKVKSHFLMPRI